MNFLRGFSKFLMIFPIITLVYDLIDGWFVKATVKIRSLQEWCGVIDPSLASDVRSILQVVLSPKIAEKALSSAAPAVLLIPPVVFYVIYRIIFALRGGQGGAFNYKSRD